MRSAKRILGVAAVAAIVASLLFMPQPQPRALAERTLDDAFAAAGLAVPDYSVAIERLGSDIRAAYGEDGTPRPGTALLNFLNGGGRLASPNPYLMPESDGEKLLFMLAEGLMQYALDATLDLSAGGESGTVRMTLDAGIDSDKCFALDGRVSLEEGGEPASEDSFYVRQSAEGTRIKPPFGDEVSTWSEPESEPVRLLRTSLTRDADDWAEVIDRLYGHLRNQPELRPMLEWALEGAPAPDSYSLTDRELVPMLRRLLLDLGTDAAFTGALSRTQLLELAATAGMPGDLSAMPEGQRSAYVAGLLCAMSSAIESDGDPLDELLMDLRCDRGRISFSAKTGVYDRSDPSRYDERFEFDFQPTPTGFTVRATAGDRYESHTWSCALDESGLDLMYARDAGAYSRDMQQARLRLTGSSALLTISLISSYSSDYAEVALDWTGTGDWVLGGTAIMDGIPVYVLTGSGGVSRGSLRGASLSDDFGIPPFNAEYAAAAGALDAEFVLNDESMSLHAEWAGRAARLRIAGMGQSIDLMCDRNPDRPRVELTLEGPMGGVGLSFSSLETLGRRDTHLELTGLDQAVRFDLSTAPLSGRDGYDYTFACAAPGVRVDISGQLAYTVDLSRPQPLLIDQSGALSVDLNGEVVRGSYALSHSFEVKERKHRDPGADVPGRDSPAQSGDGGAAPPAGPDSDSDFAPAATAPAAELDSAFAPAATAAPTRRPVNRIR